MASDKGDRSSFRTGSKQSSLASGMHGAAEVEWARACSPGRSESFDGKNRAVVQGRQELMDLVCRGAPEGSALAPMQ